MKTRVVRWYWLEAGIEMYRIEVWKDGYDHPYSTLSGTKSYHVPAGWWPWPGVRDASFRTAVREQALRMARELSEGKTVNMDGAIAEFSDGVQFSVVE